MFLFFTSNGFTQNINYSRVQFSIDQEDLTSLALQGIPLDAGVRYEKGILTGEFSEFELDIINNNGFEFEVLIEDLKAYYAKKIKNSSPVVRTEKTPANFHLGSMGGNLTLTEVMTELDEMRAL